MIDIRLIPFCFSKQFLFFKESLFQVYAVLGISV